MNDKSVVHDIFIITHCPIKYFKLMQQVTIYKLCTAKAIHPIKTFYL